MALLEVYRDEALLKTVALPEKGLFIGRKATNGLVLDDRSVSKVHAEVAPKGEGWIIRDLDSTNGIFVGGVRARMAPLTLGKEYRIGNFRLRLVETGGDDDLDPDATMPVDTAVPRGVDAEAYRDLLALFRLNSRFAAVMNTRELLDTMMDRLLEIFHADRGLVMLGTDPEEGLETSVRRGIELTGDDARTSRTFIRRALESKEPVLATDQESFPETVDQTVRSVLCAPLLEDGEPFGVVYLDCRIGARLFTDRDSRLLEAFSAEVSHAYRAAEAREKLVRQVSSRREIARADALREHEFRDIIGNSRAIRDCLEQVEAVAPQDVTVLITGESGTGKELFAKAIHYGSTRRDGPFVAINCMALSPEIIESELFGHEKGAFSGAIAQRTGKLEMADGGTVFLDEIGELSHEVQVKLLRVLQEREIQRVGGNRIIPLDVRLVTATNVDLKEEVAAGRFREDLFYRINVFSLHLPRLKERKEDLPLLVDFFVDVFNEKMGKAVDGFGDEAMRAIMEYDWPGNIRELRNVCERAMVLTRGDRIEPSALPFDLRQATAGSTSATGAGAAPVLAGEVPEDMNEAKELLEKKMIEEALERSKGNISAAARQLGVQRKTLHRKVETFGIDLEQYGRRRVELDREAILAGLEKAGGSISAAARELGVPRTTLYRNLDLFGIDAEELKGLRKP